MALEVSDRKSVSQARADFAASVIKAAWRLFVDSGYVGTSMDDVAAAVGVSKPTIYEAYKNKQALFEAVIEDVTHDFDPSATQAISDYQGPMVELFRNVPNAAKVFVRQQRRTDLIRLLISEGRRNPFLVSTYRKALWERELAAWETLLGRAMDRREFRRMDPKVAARLCAGPAVNIMIERIVYGDESVDDKVVDAFLDEAYAAIARSCLTPPPASA